MTYSSKIRKKRNYSSFSKIDGKHPFRAAVSNGFVDYSSRNRRGGEVFFFNFHLAKETGLIPGNHPNTLNKDLHKAILDTFSLDIINEYNIIHHTPIPQKDIRSQKYMATRYLQSQHPSRIGKTSGDGRSIWNGFFKGKKITWDISSCGTGATRLSPATAIENKFFQTGDNEVAYGCGRADLLEGTCAAVMSEILHHNKILTERTLAIIAFKDGISINVRASKNLLRPAHFFYHIKQENYGGLKESIDYHIERQVKNGDWPNIKNPTRKYQDMLERIAVRFAETAAQIENEYIFCWLDWDGDNVLADGSIIDYGSLRQFGLFHYEYRYDDVDRMSTTITEQKNKAKYIVQTFAQVVDFLITGKKKNIKNFKKHKILKVFDQTFEKTKDRNLLYKMGFNEKRQQDLLNKRNVNFIKDLRNFRKIYSYFEKAKSKKGLYTIADGITWDAIFCVRDIMRELPKFYLGNNQLMSPEDFIKTLKSHYATGKDLSLYQSRRSKIIQFQKLYWKFVKDAATISKNPVKKILSELTKRSALINRYDRITGESILRVAGQMIKAKKKVNAKEFYGVFRDFVEKQILDPERFERFKKPYNSHSGKKVEKILNSMMQTVKYHREEI